MIFAAGGGMMGSVFEGDETVPFEKKDTPFEARKGKRKGKRGWRAFNRVRPLDTEANVIVAEPVSASEMPMVEDQPVFVDGKLQMRRQNRVRRYHRSADFAPIETFTLPGVEDEDIRPMGPLELPDYTESRPSAIGWFGQMPEDAGTQAAAAAAKATTEEPWYGSIAKALAPVIKTGMEVYQQIKTAKKVKQTAPTTEVRYMTTGTTGTGLPGWAWAAIIGGGVLVLGVGAILILRK